MARLATFLRGAIRRKSVVILGGVALIVALAAVQTLRSQEPKFSGLDRTLVDLEERVRANPQDVEARITVSMAYGERGLYVRAAEQFEQVLILDKDNQVALGGLGKVKLQLKDYKGAEQALKRVIELNASAERRLAIDQLQEAQYYLAMTYVALNQHDAAAESAREALKMNGSDADTWRVLGDIEQRRGDYAAAEKAYMSAIAYVPNYTEVYRDLERLYRTTKRDGARQWAQGMVLLADRSPGKAMGWLEDAVRREPEFAEAHQGLAMAYESAGRSDEALVSYRRALELSPNLFLSRDAIRRLEAAAASRSPNGSR